MSLDAPASGVRVRRPVRVGVAFTLLAAVVGVVGVVVSRAGYESGGPLASVRETSVTTHARPGSVITWGTVLPTNPTVDDIRLVSIEPSEPVTGLTILGLGVSNPLHGAVGTADRYPPPGITPLPVAGAIMTPRDGTTPFIQVVVGLRLDDPGGGRIAGLRIRYVTDAHRYEMVLHDALAVVPPSPSRVSMRAVTVRTTGAS